MRNLQLRQRREMRYEKVESVKEKGTEGMCSSEVNRLQVSGRFLAVLCWKRRKGIGALREAVPYFSMRQKTSFERAGVELDRDMKDWLQNESTGQKKEGCHWVRAQIVSASEGDQSRRWHRSCRLARVPTYPTYLGDSGDDRTPKDDD